MALGRREDDLGEQKVGQDILRVGDGTDRRRRIIGAARFLFLALACRIGQHPRPVARLAGQNRARGCAFISGSVGDTRLTAERLAAREIGWVLGERATAPATPSEPYSAEAGPRRISTDLMMSRSA
jgi:hypothetical protein